MLPPAPDVLRILRPPARHLTAGESSFQFSLSTKPAASWLRAPCFPGKERVWGHSRTADLKLFPGRWSFDSHSCKYYVSDERCHSSDRDQRRNCSNITELRQLERLYVTATQVEQILLLSNILILYVV